MFSRLFRMVVPVAACAAAIACGESTPAGPDAGFAADGGSSGGDDAAGADVGGIDLPSAVSVVTIVDDVSPALFDTGAFDASSDFHTDARRAHVYDPSMQPLDTVNMILCVLGQTGASDMVNEGAYIALVNMEECDKGGDQSDPGQGGAAALTEWTIESNRADASSPMVVHTWFEEPNGPMDQAQTIMVEVVASAGVSASQPFGDFEMNFHGVGGSGELHMRGMLRTVDNAEGLPRFEFINTMGGAANPAIREWSQIEATHVILDDADSTGGRAKTFQSFVFDNGVETHEGQELYAISFDDSYLLRAKDQDDDGVADSEACADRSDYDTRAWRYNLYHRDAGDGALAGERVDMNSGFPFQTDVGGQSVRGYYGYYSIWTDGDVAIPHGQAIHRYDYDTQMTTDYTVAVSEGRLVKQTRNVLALSSAVGDSFQYWGENPDTAEFGEWLVVVTPALGFEITHRVVKDDNGSHNQELGSPVSITPTFAGESLWLWSRTLGGNVVYDHVELANDREIRFYAQQFVSPTAALLASGAVTLHCSDRCLRGGVIGAVDYDDLYYPWGEQHSYTVSVAGGAMSLVDDTSGSAVDFDGIDLSQFGHEWGINTGSMTTVQGADDTITYQWETGPNSWNRHVAVLDSAGMAVELSRPIAFAYTHSQANDANGSASHEGQTVLLEYGGDGDLWGFPYSQDEQGRHYAEFTLADGTELVADVDGDGDDDAFVVKGVELEYSMREVDAATCSGAGLSTHELLGDGVLSLPQSSDITGISFGLSDRPTVTDPPAVIEGEVQ